MIPIFTEVAKSQHYLNSTYLSQHQKQNTGVIIWYSIYNRLKIKEPEFLSFALILTSHTNLG